MPGGEQTLGSGRLTLTRTLTRTRTQTRTQTRTRTLTLTLSLTLTLTVTLVSGTLEYDSFCEFSVEISSAG